MERFPARSRARPAGRSAQQRPGVAGAPGSGDLAAEFLRARSRAALRRSRRGGGPSPWSTTAGRCRASWATWRGAAPRTSSFSPICRRSSASTAGSARRRTRRSPRRTSGRCSRPISLPRARLQLGEEGSAVIRSGSKGGRRRLAWLSLPRQPPPPAGPAGGGVRALPREIPTLARLNLPPSLAEAGGTPPWPGRRGPTGSGKSSRCSPPSWARSTAPAPPTSSPSRTPSSTSTATSARSSSRSRSASTRRRSPRPSWPPSARIPTSS